MFFDALTIAAVRDELEERVGGGRVQQVRVLGPLAWGLEIYAGHARHHLLLSAHPQWARVHLLSRAPSRDPGLRPPVLLLLRKYVRGATLQSITQPGFERVLVCTFSKVLPLPRHGATHHEEPEEPDELEESDPALAARLADIPPGFALVTTQLIAEIMGRHSNLILVDGDGVVRDAVKHIPSGINRVRVTLPHQPYVPPPTQRKLDPQELGETSFIHELASLDPQATLWQALVARFRAVSPLLAQEAVARAGAAPGAPVQAADPARLYAAVRDLFALATTHAWTPSLAWEATQEEDPLAETDNETGAEDDTPTPDPQARTPTNALAFAPYHLTHLAAEGARVESSPSISLVAEQFYAALEHVSGHAQLQADISEEIATRRKQWDRRVAALERELERAAGFESVRRKGELLLGWMHLITPGQRRLEAPDESGAPIMIDLDPDVPPVEQAQALFREYNRARAAVAGVPARLAATRLGLQYLDELSTYLELADDFDTISTIREELTALPNDPDALVAGLATPRAGADDEAPPPKKAVKPKNKGKGKFAPRHERPAAKAGRAASNPLRVTSSDGIPILIGRSARQNDAITFGLARPGDWWLHARGVPGAHVIVRGEGRQVPETTLTEAARLAAAHSKARHDTAVDVILTRRSNVRRIPGAPPGLVTVTDERVLRVRPHAREE